MSFVGDGIFRLLVDSIEDSAIAVVDTAGRIVSWNAGGERITGHSPAEMLGTDYRAWCAAGDAVAGGALGELLSGAARETRRGEGWLVGKDGRRVWAELTVSPLWSGESLRGYSLCLRDATSRKRADEAAETTLDAERAAHADAEAANHARDEFLANLSHELRTPLTSIIGWTRVLASEAHDEATLRRGLDVIRRNAMIQAQLIEELLDVSRIVHNKLRIESHALDPASVIDIALDAARPIAEAKRVTLERGSVAGDLCIKGDAQRLQQIIGNLVANAIKFTPAGGRVRVDCEQSDGRAEIRVVDDGVGIAPELLPQVFDRFRQGDESSGRKGGLGLGLAIVRHLTLLHGGTVEARSDGRGRGATFVVRLPLSDVVHHSVDRARAEPCARPRDLSGIRILLVEDEPDAREILVEILRRCGAEVYPAATAATAFAAVALFRPDVLVSDIGLEEEDGYHLIRQVRALPASQGGELPAVALTGYARSEDRARVLSAGYQMHVAKPVEPSALAQAVAALCPVRLSALGG